MRQNGPESTSLMTSLTKNPQPPSKNYFFECRLEDRALWCNRRRSYGVGKATETCWF